MSVNIEIDAPHLLPQLLAGLRAGGCLVQRINSHACRVLHGPGVDENAAACELLFYARAWALRHGDIAVSVWPEHDRGAQADATVVLDTGASISPCS